MELEFAIDPLFKKASADFDEGGAKGLLLNHLAIDANGRIVFDSSDDAEEEESEEKSIDDSDATVNHEVGAREKDIDIFSLGSKFFPDLATLDEQDICPSMKTFELGSTEKASDMPFLKSLEDWKPNPPQVSDDATLAGGFDDDENLLGGLDFNDGVGFGDGGEAWAKEVALDPQVRIHPMSMEAGDSAEGGADDDDQNERTMYGVSLRHGMSEQQNILDYFDKALHRNWAGPEHWKIRKMRDTVQAAAAGTTKRKEKEIFEIDFAAPMSQALADALYAPIPANSTTCLPRNQWKSKTRNLLPDDKHFNSRQLLRLFLKPNAGFGRNRTAQRVGHAPVPKGDVDEQFWAQQNGEDAFGQGEEGVHGNYDANFFQDDGFNAIGDDNDDEFVDARDGLTPPLDGPSGPVLNGGDGEAQTVEGPFGAQLVTQSRRMRPEYVQYARVAKKVDVRRLKEEIWKELAFEEVGVLSLHRRWVTDKDSPRKPRRSPSL
jgi:condensin complex subunit 2